MTDGDVESVLARRFSRHRIRRRQSDLLGVAAVRADQVVMRILRPLELHFLLPGAHRLDEPDIFEGFERPVYG